MIHEVILSGCAPTPLAYYLKAIGILRLVAEQADETAAGRWDGENFVLRSTLDHDALIHFFLERYRPTPIIAPWNGGSGFYEKDKHSRSVLRALRESNAVRLKAIREAIGVCDGALKRLGLREKPSDDGKSALIRLLRNSLNDDSVLWMDAVIFLSRDDFSAKNAERRNHPPLFAKGGIEGRLDFSANFNQQLQKVIEFQTGAPTEQSLFLIRGALFGELAVLSTGSPGQLFPGATGGPNSTTGFEADAGDTPLLNPWDFVLMIEGALMFAAAATRRHESSESSSISFPFTVEVTGAGAGAISSRDATTKHKELWLPIWDRFAGYRELRDLFQEGRATVGRRPVKSGLDFVRAISNFGVNRGIDSFARYAFLERRAVGQGYYLATPLGRHKVQRNAGGDLIDELDVGRAGGFLSTLHNFAQSNESPGKIVSLTRQLDDDIFLLARQFDRLRLQSVLMLLGELEAALSRSRKAREAAVPPVPPLSEAWVLKADDESPEFRIALALAGMTLGGTPMRMLVAPVKHSKTGWGWEWDEETSATWGRRSLVENIGDLLEQQLREWLRAETSQELIDQQTQVSSSHIQTFLVGATDDARIGRLVAGLSLCRQPRQLPASAEADGTLPAAYAILKAFFVSRAQLRSLAGDLDTDLVLPTEVPRLLRADRVDDALRIGWRRLQIAGVLRAPLPARPPCGAFLDGRRLLAALVVPLDANALTEMFRRLAQPVIATNETEGEGV